ncbi:MAG: DUF6443 domain-containing protein [Agriterribacter sp.]
MPYTIYQPAKLLSALLLCILCVFTHAQQPVPASYPGSTTVNYIRTWEAKAPEQNANTLMTRGLRDVQQTTQYFDGLGRPLQTVIKQGSYTPGGVPTDLISPVIYDAFGREQYKYLPFASTATDGTQNDGNFKPDPFAQQVAFYNTRLSGQTGETNIGTNGENWAYSKTNYEPSPLNRVDNTYAPGAGWVGSEGAGTEALKKNLRIKYYANTLTDDVKIWKVTNGADLGDWGSYAVDVSAGVSGVYEAGDLYKTIIIDENDKQVIEFKDKEGRVILKKVQLNNGVEDDGSGKNYTGWLCTYYIYDNPGNLRCVIPPAVTQQLALPAVNWNLMETTNLLERGAYCYEYDSRRRMIMKKVAGVPRTDAVYMVYDARDRLVMTQDGKQRRPAAASRVWIVTLYDELDRPVIKGFYVNALNNKTFKQNLEDAYNSTAYPFAADNQPPLNVYWSQTAEWHYDDYDNIPTLSGLTKNFDATYKNSDYLYTTYNTSPLYAQEPIQSFRTKGMVTWTRELILSSQNYIYTVNIYDDKGRIIQVKTKNFRTGTDLTTTQYNWAGQPLRIVHKHQLPAVSGTTGQSTLTLTDISYDDLGRAIQTQKKIQNTLVNSNALPAAWTKISTNIYDALGQIERKTMGNKRDAAGNYTASLLCSQEYAYNIRGWLLSINKDYTNASTNSDRYFSLELGYDKDPTIGANGSKQYNGNIGAMLWKSEGDQQRRKYDFVYDNANRLLAANFGQYISGSGGSAAFNNDIVDFSENGITYDYNGNIKTLRRKGLKLNESPLIDDLSYTYYSYEDRPYKVTDAITGSDNGSLGDFKDGVQAADYNYNNGNGSLTTDFNKGITGIEYYRTIELPKTITTAKGTINNVYNTDGDKLSKTTIETSATVAYNGTDYTGISITTTTTYLGGAVYESKAYTNNSTLNTALGYTDRLLFTAHEEGRIRAQYNNASTPNTPTGFVYDYFIKDHLGNIRMVLTDEYKQDIYPAATLEGDINTNSSPNAVFKEKDYYTIDPAKIAPKTDATGITDYVNHNGNPPANNNPYSNTTANSAKLYKLKATATEGVTGLGITLKVMAGDRIDIFGKSYYFTNNTGGTGANSAIPVLDILTGLLGGPTGGTAASAHGGVTASQLNGIGDVTSGVTTLLGSQTTDAAGAPAVPKAYINYIFFDEQFKVAASGFSKVGSNSVVKTHTDLTNKTAPKNGYVYIYVSNESPVDVFFDNLQVVHTRGAILEETHYYPYGMKMAGISSKTFDALKNPYQYQGDYSEFDDETGWNDFYLRSYDAQTGRFVQIDPYDQFPSPYTGMGNNPVGNIDPSGGYIFDMAAGQFWGMGIGMVAGSVGGYFISKANGGNGMDGALMGAVGGGALGYGVGSVNWSGVGNALGNAGRWVGNGFQKEWQPLYKSDLINYLGSTDENALGKGFEKLFEEFASKDPFMRASNVRPNVDKFSGGFRNTIPDFIGDAFITREIGGVKVDIPIRGSDWYELKQKNGSLYSSSNDDQIAGHIDNLRNSMDWAYQRYNRKLGYQAKLYLVTTADVKASENIGELAMKNNLLYEHIHAQYKIINNKWKFNFKKTALTTQKW